MNRISNRFNYYLFEIKFLIIFLLFRKEFYFSIIQKEILIIFLLFKKKFNHFSIIQKKNLIKSELNVECNKMILFAMRHKINF